MCIVFTKMADPGTFEIIFEARKIKEWRCPPLLYVHVLDTYVHIWSIPFKKLFHRARINLVLVCIVIEHVIKMKCPVLF